MLAAGPSRREPPAVGRASAGAARSPRLAGAATILAVAAVVTAAALPSAEHAAPSVTPRDAVGPEPAGGGGPAAVGTGGGAVPLHRMAATLGESAEAARLQAEAVEKALRIRTRVNSGGTSRLTGRRR